jgi:hypothetical protein
LPLLAIGALAALIGLLAIAAVYFVSSQRSSDEDLEPAIDSDFDDGRTDDSA